MRKACFGLLAAALALTLCACAKPIVSPVPAATAALAPLFATEGAAPAPDWRAPAQYAPGTISADKKLAVLYRLEGSQLAVYLDAPQQQVVLKLDLSGLSDPSYSADTLGFGDKNDDGYNDLCLPLPKNGGSLFYLWDMDAKHFTTKPLAAAGLWLTIHDWPQEATLRNAQENEEGAASYTWYIPGGPSFVLERLLAAEPGAKAVQKLVAGFEALQTSSVRIREDSALSQRLTYPAYRLEYATEGDGGFFNEDLYVQTDNWDFRLHVVTPVEVKQAYAGMIDRWFSSLVFQDTSAVTAG